MAKNTFYFSHDSNARNDEKLLAVRMRLGAEGYGVYFMLLERLSESTDYMSVKDYNVIAFDLRVGADVVKKIIEDFDLFEFTEDKKFFYSKSFLERMKPLEDIKELNRIKGIRGSLIKRKIITKEESFKLTDNQIIELNLNSKNKPSLSQTKAELKPSLPKNKHNISKVNIINTTTEVVVEKKEEVKKSLPSPILENHIAFCQELILSKKWLETFQMSLKIPISENNVYVKRLLKEFLNHLILEDKNHTRKKDFQSHFTSWCRKLDNSKLTEIYLKQTKQNKKLDKGDYYFLN